MSKLIKHEFRASSRQMLIILSVCFCSAVLSAICSSFAPNWVFAWLMTIFGVSLFLIFVMTFVILIGRFYRNTMTDTGYLTMTLPISAHEFIWGELITSLLWVIISVAVISVAGLFCAIVSGYFSREIFIDMFSFAGEILRSLNKYGTNVVQVIVVSLELVVAMCLAFVLLCLRFYCAMSVGQLFSKHRGLMSVVAYFIIGSLITVGSYFVFMPVGNVITLSMGTVEMVITTLGIVNLGLAICGAIIYLPTVLILSKKLNLP